MEYKETYLNLSSCTNHGGFSLAGGDEVKSTLPIRSKIATVANGFPILKTARYINSKFDNDFRKASLHNTENMK